MPGKRKSDPVTIDLASSDVEGPVERVEGKRSDGLGQVKTKTLFKGPEQSKQYKSATQYKSDTQSKSATPSTNTKATTTQIAPKIDSRQSLETPNLNKSNSAKSQQPTAFDILMSKKDEQLAWQKAEESERRVKAGGRPMKAGGTRPAPFYKIMPGMPIAVDAFRYGTIPGIQAYFLSHAHSDHYTNLSKAWKSGPIYASQTTCNLIAHMLKVDPKWINPLPDLVPTVLANTGGVSVTLIPANHCPGSSLFLFEGMQTTNPTNPNRPYTYLHTGDMRASPAHVNSPFLKGKHIDTVYLDTTYLNPNYSFPSQPMVIHACANMVKHRIKLDGQVPEEVALKTGEQMFENWIKKRPKSEAPSLDGFVKREGPPSIKRGVGNGPGGVKKEEDLGKFILGVDASDVDQPRTTTTSKKEEDMCLNETDRTTIAANHDIDVIETMKAEEVDALDHVLKNEDPTEDSIEDIDPTEFEPEAQDEWISEFPILDDPDMVPFSTLNETKPLVPKTLVVVGTYSIGKERIAKGIAHALESKIYADPRKMAILNCITDDCDLKTLLVSNPFEAQVHLVPLRMIDTVTLSEYLAKLRGHFDKVVGFRCTGWTYRADAGTDLNPSVETLLKRDSNKRYTEAHLSLARGSNSKVQMYNVPYSEHSSFFELTAFALSLSWNKMIATVNIGSATSRLKMQKWFDKWAEERKRRQAMGLTGPVPARADDYW